MRAECTGTGDWVPVLYLYLYLCLCLNLYLYLYVYLYFRRGVAFSVAEV